MTTAQKPIVTVDNYSILQINSDPFDKARYALFDNGELLSVHRECGFAISEMIKRVKGEYTAEAELKKAIVNLFYNEKLRQEFIQNPEMNDIKRKKQAYQEERDEIVCSLLVAAEKMQWI